ncbi:cytochrome B5-like protein [Actinia tenebrosa]|uniref:Cytochrome B5-like protein n=1 Tax=Actinia tenebrosa TaxID=6105 RepID=A0A6P8IEW6_ACTTE|nr:cytochrome B5-like protein [Actinia tenebrosa]
MSSGCGVMDDRIVELEEVKQHKSEDDLWIIIDGKVYDVTPYVTEHPGGKAIFRNAGDDSSGGFHSQKAHGIVKNHINSLLKAFYVGRISQDK